MVCTYATKEDRRRDPTDRSERLNKRRASQKEIVALMRRRGETSQNELRETLGSVAGLRGLMDMKVVIRDPKHFGLTLAE
jgi:hypothetical protein